MSRCNSVSKVRFGIHSLLWLFFLLPLSLAPLCAAESPEYQTFNTPRFTLHFDRSRYKGPSPSPGDVKTPEEIASHALKALDKTYEDLKQIFQSAPKRKVVLRFLSPEQFRIQTGAPDWTSAMFYRDEITVPLNPRKPIDLEELGRALRHEYVHAFIAEVSNYRCPAWLDEGVAQLIEGDPNPLLGPALRRWVVFNDAIPLDMLHNGFTTLDAAIVPAAYAQSLFASRMLIDSLGYEAIGKYLETVSQGTDENIAFHRSFGISKRSFEASLNVAMRQWAVSSEVNP